MVRLGAAVMVATVDLAVVGAHLEGMPLHHQLADRGATLVTRTRTECCYRLYALLTDPPKPGLLRVGQDDPGAGSIEVEVWRLPAEGFATFVDGVPAPLAIGRVRLEGSREVAGFVCEPIGLVGADDITATGGWRAHVAAGGPAV